MRYRATASGVPRWARCWGGSPPPVRQPARDPLPAVAPCAGWGATRGDPLTPVSGSHAHTAGRLTAHHVGFPGLVSRRVCHPLPPRLPRLHAPTTAANATSCRDSRLRRRAPAAHHPPPPPPHPLNHANPTLGRDSRHCRRRRRRRRPSGTERSATRRGGHDAARARACGAWAEVSYRSSPLCSRNTVPPPFPPPP